MKPTEGKPGLIYDGFQYIVHREAKSSGKWRCTKKVKDDFIISHLEGAAWKKLRYRSSTERKTSEAVLGTSREGFGELSTISELLSNIYQCRQNDGQACKTFRVI